MSHTPLNRDSQQQNTVIFSFGQQERKALLTSHSSAKASDTKMQFILKLISQYESRRIFAETVPVIESVKPYQQNSQHLHSTQGQSTSCHKLSSPTFEETTDQDSIISRFKSDLQETHQLLVNKYFTPIRQPDDMNEKVPTKDCLFNNRICEFLDTSLQEENLVQSINRESVPMVESLLMDNFNESETKSQLQMKSEIIELKESAVNKEALKDELKITHVLTLCLIILALFIWKM